MVCAPPRVRVADSRVHAEHRPTLFVSSAEEIIKANLADPGLISHFLGFSAHDSGSDVSDYY
jgi:hypothetical protein